VILVTGATGQVGGEAARELVAARAPVRVLVRDLSRAASLSGVEVVEGSFDDDASLARAVDGVETMLLAGRDSPDAVSQQLTVLDHARRAGVQHVVKLSAIGASSDSPIALMRDHHEVDEELRRGSAPWTLLKPHLFLQNLLRASDGVRRQGQLAAPMGGESFPLVDTRDIGAAAAMVLLDPARHANQTYGLTGPAALGYDEVASAIGAVAGRPVTYEPVTPEDYEARLLEAGVPAWRAFDLAHIASAYTSADRAVTNSLETILDRPPRSLSQFLADHHGAFD
jgi:uncharacterized protein YbjT (DUF2867 family)